MYLKKIKPSLILTSLLLLGLPTHLHTTSQKKSTPSTALLLSTTTLIFLKNTLTTTTSTSSKNNLLNTINKFQKEPQCLTQQEKNNLNNHITKHLLQLEKKRSSNTSPSAQTIHKELTHLRLQLQSSLRPHELLIPADGNCLYTSCILGYLLPTIDQPNTFNQRLYNILNTESHLINPTQLALHYNDLDYLHSNTSFQQLIKTLRKKINTPPHTWGGPHEIKEIAEKLNINIQEHTPNPDNPTQLVKSDFTSPSTHWVEPPQATINIIQDIPFPDEIIPTNQDPELSQTKLFSLSTSQHRHHYRLYYTKKLPKPQKKNTQQQPTPIQNTVQKKNKPNTIPQDKQLQQTQTQPIDTSTASTIFKDLLTPPLNNPTEEQINQHIDTLTTYKKQLEQLLNTYYINIDDLTNSPNLNYLQLQKHSQNLLHRLGIIFRSNQQKIESLQKTYQENHKELQRTQLSEKTNYYISPNIYPSIPPLSKYQKQHYTQRLTHLKKELEQAQKKLPISQKKLYDLQQKSQNHIHQQRTHNQQINNLIAKLHRLDQKIQALQKKQKENVQEQQRNKLSLQIGWYISKKDYRTTPPPFFWRDTIITPLNKQQKKNYTQELHQLKKSYQNISKQITTLQQQHGTLEQTYNTPDHTTPTTYLPLEINHLKRKIKNLEKKKQHCLQDINRINLCLDTHHDISPRSYKNMQPLTPTEKKDYPKQLIHLKKSYNKNQDTINQINSQCIVLEQELNDHQKQYTIHTQQRKKTQQQIHHLQTQISTLQYNHKTYPQQIQQLTLSLQAGYNITSKTLTKIRPLKKEEKDYIPLIITKLEAVLQQINHLIDATKKVQETLLPILQKLIHSRIHLQLLQPAYQQYQKKTYTTQQPYYTKNTQTTLPSSQKSKTFSQKQYLHTSIPPTPTQHNKKKKQQLQKSPIKTTLKRSVKVTKSKKKVTQQKKNTQRPKKALTNPPIDWNTLFDSIDQTHNINHPLPHNYIPNFAYPSNLPSNTTHPLHLTPLHLAAYTLNYDATLTCLKKGAYVNINADTTQHYFPITPLYLVASKKTNPEEEKEQLRIINLLIEQGALVWIRQFEKKHCSLYTPNTTIRSHILHHLHQEINLFKTKKEQCTEALFQQLSPHIITSPKKHFWSFFNTDTQAQKEKNEQLRNTLYKQINTLTNNYHLERDALIIHPTKLYRPETTYLYQQLAPSLYQEFIEILHTLQPFYTPLIENTITQLQQLINDQKRELHIQQIAQDDEKTKNAYRQIAQSIHKAEKAIDALQHQIDLIQHQRNLLLTFYQKLQQHPLTFTNNEEPLQCMHKTDTYQKTQLGILQHLYFTTYELQRLQHERNNTYTKLNQLKQEAYQIERERAKRMTTDEKVGLGLTGGLFGIFSGIITVIAPPIGIPLIAASAALTGAVANDIEKDCNRRCNNVTLDTTHYFPNPKAINYPAANLYTEDIKQNFKLTFGSKNQLTLTIQSIDRHHLNLTKDLSTYEIKQAYKKNISSRITFLNTYLKQIKTQINQAKEQQRYFTHHPKSDQQLDPEDSDDEDPHLQLDLLQHQGTIEAIQKLLQHLQNLYNDIQIELITLQLESNQLNKKTPSLEAYFCPQLHPYAYNRKQLQYAQNNLIQQLHNLQQKAEAFKTDIEAVHNQTQHLVIEKTPSLLKLFELNSNILQSNLSTSIIGINTLQLRSQQLQEIIAYRTTLAQYLGMGTRLLANQLIMLCLNTLTGPIGIIVTAGLNTLAGKSIEDLVLNGGDFQGWQDDLCSKETLSQVTKSALTSLCINVIPLATQKVLPKKILKKLQKINKSITTKDSVGTIIEKTAMNIATEFGDNITSILTGRAVDHAISHLTKNNTPPNTILSNDPSNPHYTATHKDQPLTDEIFYALKNSFLVGITASITNLVGDKYTQHLHNNTTKNKLLGSPTLKGYVGHKVTHGIIGCLYGAGQYYIQGRTTPQELIHAAKSGGLSAIVGEVISEAYYTHIILPGLENIIKKTSNHTKLNRTAFEKHYQQQIKKAVLAGKLAAIGNAYVLGSDLEIASRSVNNAIDNNFALTAATVGVCVLQAIQWGMKAWMVYDLYCVIKQAENIYNKTNGNWEAVSEYLIKQAALELFIRLATKGLGIAVCKLAKSKLCKVIILELEKKAVNNKGKGCLNTVTNILNNFLKKKETQVAKKIAPQVLKETETQALRKVETELLGKGLKKSKNLAKKSSKIKIHPNQNNHIFTNKHLIQNTPQNRSLLERIANNPKLKLGHPDQHGAIWHAELQPNGSQVWARIRNGKIINAGINKIPRTWNPKTGLCNPPPRKP